MLHSNAMDEELNDGLNDEVIFWMHMIEDWEVNNDGPVPERMHEALELAKFKLRLVEAEYIPEVNLMH